MKYREQFSKLLATENIRLVQKAGAKTAAFDTMNRVLYLPVWDVSESVYDMLVAHEVSHALHTPQGDRRVSTPRYNIVEDARIERLILAKYPGYERIFKEAYIEVKTALPAFAEMLSRLDTLKSIDRLNLAWKFRDNSFLNAVELDWFYRGLKTESFEECVGLANEIVEYEAPEPEEPEESAESGGSDEEDTDYDSDEEGGDGVPDDAESTEEESESDEDSETGDVGTDDESEGDKSDDEADDEAEGGKSDDEAEGGKSDDESDGDGKASSDDIDADDTAEDSDKDAEDSSKRSASDNKSDSDAERDEDEGGESQNLFDDFAEDNVDLSNRSTPITLEEKALRNMVNSNQVKAQYNTIDEMMNFGTLRVRRDIKRRESLFDAGKPVTRSLVKEFKRRKNAHELLRTQSHRTGKINTKKLYRYKMDDNIFLSRNVVEGAGNHGLTMFVDFSGSMHQRLNNALAMVYTLSDFALQCGIKFQVFGFLSAWNHRDRDPSELRGEGIFNVNYEGVEIFKIVDSNMRMKQVRMNLHQAARRSLGGTPLDATILAGRVLHSDFLKKHQIEKSMIVFLTDGGNGERTAGQFTYSDGATVDCNRPMGSGKTRQIAKDVENLLPGNCKIINIYMTRIGNREWLTNRDTSNDSFERTHLIADSTFSKTRLNVKGCTSLDGLEQAVENHASDTKEMNKIISEIIKEFA